MAVKQTLKFIPSNETYKNMQEIEAASMAVCPSSFHDYLDKWRSSYVAESFFDIETQTFTVVKNWVFTEDYNSYMENVPDSDGIRSAYQSAGWTISVEVEYINLR